MKRILDYSTANVFIMYNFTSTTYSSASQNSTEIAKMIRQGFLGAETPTYEGQKIAKRTNANASVIRDVDDWKITYYRRAGHKSQGFFSALVQPYEELGETELNTKSLVVNAMKDIGAIFDPEVSKRRNVNNVLNKETPLAPIFRYYLLFTIPHLSIPPAFTTFLFE